MVAGVLDLQCESGLGGWLRTISHAHNQTVHVVLTAQDVVPASHQCLQVLARLDGVAAHCQRILAECKLSKGLLVHKSLKQDR
jgi:hypothetical protein